MHAYDAESMRADGITLFNQVIINIRMLSFLRLGATQPMVAPALKKRYNFSLLPM